MGADAPFYHPTLDEVRSYCKERNNNVDPETWFHHYDGNGWKVGKNPMKKWKSAIITWERNGGTNGKSVRQPPQTLEEEIAERVRRANEYIGGKTA